MKAREAAYLSLLRSLRDEQFVIHSLAKWQQEENPTPQDFAFAHEIASGSARMALALDHIGTELSTSKKLSLKLKEKALLRTAIYQYCFMSKVPLYAIVNESIEIAKKYCHQTFASYLNALLRQLEKQTPSLPEGISPKEMSIRYSYPHYFVTQLIIDYGQNTAENILKLGNIPSKTMVRVRPGVDINSEALKMLSPIKETGIPIAIMEKASALSAISAMPEIYIQNATSVALVGELAARTETPKNILDLCASPGGKLIATHDIYPEAKLFANDISEEKIFRLSENLKKYGIKAHLNSGLGEEYTSETLFDLIILDVPCSNSGVLNKRAEARWRLTPEAIDDLHKKQEALLKHATTLLSKKGKIWYMTCSILRSENEEIVSSIAKKCELHMLFSQTILPNPQGWDGGFGCLLSL